MIRKEISACLPLGQVVATPGVLGAVPTNELMAALNRHQHLDWGDLPPEDLRANDYALTHGERILSAYRASDKKKFWIITEANRAATTLLLPEEY